MQKSTDLGERSPFWAFFHSTLRPHAKSAVCQWRSCLLVAAAAAIGMGFGSVPSAFAASPLLYQEGFEDLDEGDDEEEGMEEKADTKAKPAKKSPRLVRNWQARLPVGANSDGKFPVKVLIPSRGHAAFQLKPDAPLEKIPEGLELVINLQTEAGSKKISSRQIGPSGKMLGYDGARTFADIHTNLLKDRGFKVERSAQFLPNAVAYSITNTGIVQALDAESGKLIWSRSITGVRGPIVGFDVSDRYVAVLQGTRLVIFNSADGDELFKVKLRIVPAAPPVIDDKTVVIVSQRGVIEAVEVSDKKHFVARLGGYGGGFSQELENLGSSVIWGTKDSFFMASNKKPTVPLYRIPCDINKFSKPAGFGDIMIVSGEEGKLSCFSQGSGRHFWDGYFDNRIVGRPFMIEIDPKSVPKFQKIMSLESQLKPQEENEAEKSSDDSGESEENVFGDGSDDEFDFGGDSSDASDDEEEEDGEGVSIGKNVLKRGLVKIEDLIGSKKAVRALVIEQGGMLIAVDLKTGQRIKGFSTQGIRKVLGANDSFIVARATNGDVVSLDKINGRILDRYPLYGKWTGFRNGVSDRIYLRNESGQILCLRPEFSGLPNYATPKNMKKLKDEEKKKKEEEDTEEDEDDVFG